MQWIELIAYARLRNKMMNLCPICSKHSRSEPKKCFQCGGKYFEEDGGAGGPVKTGAEAFEIINRLADKG